MIFKRDRNAKKLTAGKSFAILASLLIALPCLLGFTASASKPVPPDSLGQTQEPQSPEKARRIVVVDGKVVSGDVTTDQSKLPGSRNTEVKWTDDQGSGTISAKNIRLTSDGDDVKSIAKDGHLVIDETSGGIRRQLKLEPDKDGKLKRTYSVRGVVQEFDEEGQAWLSKILHDYLTYPR
jgi:hypothetical protein